MNVVHLHSLLFCLILASSSKVFASTPNAAEKWPDKSHRYISNKADDLARWVDSFFHSEDFETESADSFMRLRATHFWYESRDNNIDIGFRGKANLPALDERITLVIYDNDDPESDGSETHLDEQDNKTDISLQFNEVDKGRHRIDYRVGIRSSGAFKSSVRYRYRLSKGHDRSLQFVNKIRFREDEGFENIMRYRHDKALSNSRILQYRARLNYGEITEGVEWLVSTAVTKKLPDSRAITYFGEISGITRPDILTTEYGTGINFRASFGKPYFYWELRPGYYLERESRKEARQGYFRLLARIEILFD